MHSMVGYRERERDIEKVSGKSKQIDLSASILYYSQIDYHILNVVGVTRVLAVGFG